MTDPKIAASDARREWVSPEIGELAVQETAGFPGVGGDGGVNADCTLS